MKTNTELAIEVITLALRNDEYLKTLQKALVFDEGDKDSFENTYHEMLDQMIATNWEMHRLGEEIKRREFKARPICDRYVTINLTELLKLIHADPTNQKNPRPTATDLYS